MFLFLLTICAIMIVCCLAFAISEKDSDFLIGVLIFLILGIICGIMETNKTKNMQKEKQYKYTITINNETYYTNEYKFKDGTIELNDDEKGYIIANENLGTIKIVTRGGK